MPIRSFLSWLTEAAPKEPLVVRDDTVATKKDRQSGSDLDGDGRVNSDSPDNQAMLVLNPKAKLKDSLATKAKEIRLHGDSR